MTDRRYAVTKPCAGCECLTKTPPERSSPGCTWLQELCALIERYRPMLERMGFPEGWRQLAFWARCNQSSRP